VKSETEGATGFLGLSRYLLEPDKPEKLDEPKKPEQPVSRRALHDQYVRGRVQVIA
jgi:hypothetical protein